MKSYIILSGFLLTVILTIASGFTISGKDGKPDKTECPYFQENSEKTCTYLEGKIDKLNSECPYLNGEINCPYGNKDSKPEAESSNKCDSKEKKYYRSIKNIST